MKAVQQLAGHASAKMTLDTYSHVLEQYLGGVGGSRTSAHLDGLAVDIKPKSGLHADYMRIMDYLYPLVTCKRIDQLIVYCKTPHRPDLGVKWIHIGFREDYADNRCQTIYK